MPKVRRCRHCGDEFQPGPGDNARRHCSKRCAKAHHAKAQSAWRADHPDAMDGYNANRLAKNPGAWRDKARADRLATLAMLGGACVVCGVTNPSWLHVDYIPTSHGSKYRHPRGVAWVRKHLDDFRLLCANHLYELTLTGRIEGTSITQPRWTRDVQA